MQRSGGVSTGLPEGRSAATALLALLLGAATAWGGFAGTDVFLPMVGRQAGVHPSNWYTAVWIHNPGSEAASARIHLLERGTANPAPPWVDIMIAPGDTELIDNIVETLFHVEVFGALRVTCATQKLVVASRVYSRAVGAGVRDSVGQDFAGVPASFAIGLGKRTTILGVHQTLPNEASDFRYNFGFVETTGHSATVRVRAFDGNGADQGAVDLQVRAWSQRQVAFRDQFPGVSIENARFEVEVIAGTGKVIGYGSGIANGSQDPTTFEMQYADALLGTNTVQHDATLVGDGTAGAPLGLADGGVATARIADGAVTAPKLATSAPPAPPPAGAGAMRADPLEALFKIGDAMFWDLAFTGDITAVNTAAGSGLTGGVTEGDANLAIAAGGVTTAMLALDAVTSDRIAPGAVNGSDINDRAVTTAKIAPSGIEGHVLTTSGGSVVWGTPASGDITGVYSASGLTGGAASGDATLSIADGGVTNAKLAAGAVTTDKIADGTIVGADIDSDTTISVAKLQGGGTTIVATGVYGSASSGAGVMGNGSGKATTGVYGYSQLHHGVWGESSSGDGVRGDSSSSSGVHGNSSSNRGVWGEAGGIGTGVWGTSGDGYGVYGISTGNGNFGRLGTPTTGVYGQSAGGNGVYGISTSSQGVYGKSTSDNGVYGISTSSQGVYGKSTSDYGVYGESPANVGVYGSTTSGWGVYGYTANYIGVQGINNTTGHWGRLGTNSYGGSFHGNVDIDGNLSKNGGAFKIDHPLDPGGKYLYHSFVESPDMKNIYDGVVTLGPDGGAAVELPEWFEALNRDFRYQLTCLGGFAPVYVAEEIAGNRFRIAGGTAGLKVSWQVTGTRHDAWAEAHRIQVEEVKPAAEQGRYRHPELFGQPPEMMVDADAASAGEGAQPPPKPR